MKEVVARKVKCSAEQILREAFQQEIDKNTIIDGIFYDSTYKSSRNY